MREPPTEDAHRHDIVAGLLPGIVFLASIPLAFVDTTLAYLAWLLIFPAEQVVDRLVPETATDP